MVVRCGNSELPEYSNHALIVLRRRGDSRPGPPRGATAGWRAQALSASDPTRASAVPTELGCAGGRFSVLAEPRAKHRLGPLLIVRAHPDDRPLRATRHHPLDPLLLELVQQRGRVVVVFGEVQIDALELRHPRTIAHLTARERRAPSRRTWWVRSVDATCPPQPPIVCAVSHSVVTVRGERPTVRARWPTVRRESRTVERERPTVERERPTVRALRPTVGSAAG